MGLSNESPCAPTCLFCTLVDRAWIVYVFFCLCYCELTASKP